jgi:hypothetical protein
VAVSSSSYGAAATSTLTSTSAPSITAAATSSLPAVSTSSSATSTSSPAAIPTLSHPATIGQYSFVGCYTEGLDIRALTGAVHYEYADMTIEECYNFCDGYEYWGVEYFGECK